MIYISSAYASPLQGHIAYFFHLESCDNGLNQDRPSDSSTRHGYVVLRKVEDIVPETSLEMRLHLWEIEVWSGPGLDKLVGVVEEVEAEIEQTAGDGFPINREMLLLQVPSSGSSNERRQCSIRS